jgi:hypothetical protein
VKPSAEKRARGHCSVERGTGLPPLSPRPSLRAGVLRRFAPIAANGINLLAKSITSPENQKASVASLRW